MKIEDKLRIWAKSCLTELGYEVFGESEMVRAMPWSQVARFHTSSGLVYLKKTAEPFSNEPNLLSFLANIGITSVPKIIAQNTDMYGFLMSGAGDTLRPILKNKKYDVTLPTRALKIYADMQIQCIPHVQTLLNNAGVNDWRLEKLPKLYKNFIENEKLLLDDGLVEADIKNLKNFYSKFEGLCESLASLGIPETLEQGDFQDNNILIQENKVTLHDFGDASITHPFFSLSSFLNSAARHHGIQESDEVYQALYESYMGPWYTCYSEKSCFKAFKQAKIIGLFVFALSFTRIKACPGIEAFPEYNGYISEALKLLIKNTV